MSITRATTIALLLSVLLAAFTGCGGGGGSSSGPGIAPGASGGSLSLRVDFSDQAPRLQVSGNEAVLAASSSTERLVIDILDGSNSPVVPTTTVERTPGQPLTVVIRNIPFGTWKLQILTYYAGETTPYGRFAQEITIAPGAQVSVVATVTPYASPSTSPSPRVLRTFAYVADTGGDTLTGNEIDATGALTQIPGSPWTTAAPQPFDLAAAPSGRFLFASLHGTETTVGGHQSFQVGLDGALTSASYAATGMLAYPSGLASHPTLTQPRVYGLLQGFGQLLQGRYDPSTGALAMGAGSSAGADLGRVAVRPDGTALYVADGASVVAYDLDANGDASNPRSVTLPGTINRLEMHPNGSLLFATIQAMDALKVMLVAPNGDLTLGTGSGSALGSTADAKGMAVSADGQYLFVAVPGGSYVGVVRFTADGSVLDLVTSHPLTGVSPRDVAVAPDGTVFVVSAGSAGPGDMRTYTFTTSPSPSLLPTGRSVGTGNEPTAVVVVRR